jgi:hypothetical protein
MFIHFVPKRHVVICQAPIRLLPVHAKVHFISLYGFGYKPQAGNENKLLTFGSVPL